MFGTVAALKKARDAGTIKDGDNYHRFIEKLVGSEQSKYNKELAADLEHVAAQERPRALHAREQRVPITRGDVTPVAVPSNAHLVVPFLAHPGRARYHVTLRTRHG